MHSKSFYKKFMEFDVTLHNPAGAWRGVDLPPPSSAEVTEKVQLYHYSPSGPSWHVLGEVLPFPPFFTLHTQIRLTTTGVNPTSQNISILND